MVRNKLTDLTNTLFAQLETLDDRDLTADELKIELQRSKQMVAISGQILQAGQLALDAEKFKDKVGEVNAPIRFAGRMNTQNTCMKFALVD